MEPSLVAQWDRDASRPSSMRRSQARGCNSFLRSILAESKLRPRLQRKFAKSFQLVAMRSRRETMCQRSDMISTPKARGYLR